MFSRVFASMNSNNMSNMFYLVELMVESSDPVFITRSSPLSLSQTHLVARRVRVECTPCTACRIQALESEYSNIEYKNVTDEAVVITTSGRFIT